MQSTRNGNGASPRARRLVFRGQRGGGLLVHILVVVVGGCVMNGGPWWRANGSSMGAWAWSPLRVHPSVIGKRAVQGAPTPAPTPTASRPQTRRIRGVSLLRHEHNLPSLEEVMERGIGVGIDLGTTNSCVAILNEDGTPVVVPLDDTLCTKVLPSAVHFGDEHVVVGTEALALDPSRTCRHVKRCLGRMDDAMSRSQSESVRAKDYDDDGRLRRQLRRTVPHLSDDGRTLELAAAGGETNTNTNTNTKQKITPVEVSAAVLKELFRRAEDFVGVGSKVTRAVVGVPAYFGDGPREATLEACRAAGVSKVRLLREPEAAALAYGVGRRKLTNDSGRGNAQTHEKNDLPDSELVMVFDLGGGTFDVSFLEVSSDGVIEVVATGGDDSLGGTDFDRRLASRFADLTGAVGKGSGKHSGASTMDAMARIAERARIALSNRRSVDLRLPTTAEGWATTTWQDVLVPFNEPDNTLVGVPSPTNDTNPIRLYTLTRSEMEALCLEEFRSLLRPIREAAIMAGAMLPGDADPQAVEVALRVEAKAVDGNVLFPSFYDDDDDNNNNGNENDDNDNRLLKVLETDPATLRAKRKEQQRGRRKARDRATASQAYRKEKKRTDASTHTKPKGMGPSPSQPPPTQKKSRGIHGRPISRVVLVGGATRTPAIGRLLRVVCGVEPEKTVDPDLAVALGCAVQVGILDGNAHLDGNSNGDNVLPTVLTPIQAALARAIAEKEERNRQAYRPRPRPRSRQQPQPPREQVPAPEVYAMSDNEDDYDDDDDDFDMGVEVDLDTFSDLESLEL